MTIKILKAAVSITYIERVREGEEIKTVEKEYEHPMMEVCYKGETDQEVVPGATYTDEEALYMGLGDKEVVNISTVVRSFQLPGELVLIGTDYSDLDMWVKVSRPARRESPSG